MNSRRQFLRASAATTGGLLLSPILSQIQAQAAGTRLPPRFLFVVEGNGLEPPHITPTGYKRPNVHVGKPKVPNMQGVTELVNESLADKQLPESLQPIKPWQDRLTVINGLSGRIAGGGHSNDFGALGAYNCGSGVGSSGTPTDETIDVALGKKLGGIFPHFGIGISGRKDDDVIYNSSAWGKGQPTPTICQPMTSYGALFGSIAGGNSKAEFNARTNLLDFLREDVKRLQGQVAGAEHDKLQAHLKGYEDMRNRQSRLGQIEGTLRRTAPKVTDKFKSEVESDRLDAQFDIAAAALIGGLTRSITIASGVGNPYFSIRFTGLGIDLDKHSIGHGGSFNGMNPSQLKVKIHKFHFQLIADLMKKLDAVPEGDGTMLDNTVIVYLSDAAEAHHSRCGQWPFVLIPGRNTGLKGGQYIDFPHYMQDGHREIGNLYTTLLHAAGDKREYFGVHDAMLKGEAHGDGPLEPLFA
ncbi:MAG: DUF1552 domain-containing protein [Planctomycetes bacterium]|nr:DUF1552 domain-containing protein [Planctomycetota bacterium]|tara:strand:- start:2100 stop:3506 length:1407 start_codon:yes stop_codon:yes gene_type:complete